MARKIRKTINVRTTKQGSQQILSELKSSLLEQATTGKPTSGLSDIRQDKNSALNRLSSAEKSKRNTFNSYSNISSGLGVLFGSFPIVVGRDGQGNATLDTGPVEDVFESVLEICQPPDSLVEDSVRNQQEEIDNSFFGVTSLVDALLDPLVNFGVSSPNTPTLPDELPGADSILQNPVERLTQTRIKLSGGRIQGLNREITQEEFKRIPNHYKTLFRTTRNSSGDVDSKVSSNSREERDLARAETAFTYEMMVKVSYLVGYEKKEDGTPIMSKQIWEELTEEKYNQITGKSILCKMEPYTNPALGITPNNALKPNIHDEYFLLAPKTQAPQPQPALPDYSIVSPGGDSLTQTPVKTSLASSAISMQKQVSSVPAELTSNNQVSNKTLGQAITDASMKAREERSNQNNQASTRNSSGNRSVPFQLAYRVGDSILSGQSEPLKPSSAETILKSKNKKSK